MRSLLRLNPLTSSTQFFSLDLLWELPLALLSFCSFASAAGTLCCLMLKPLPQAYGISTSLLDLNS